MLIFKERLRLERLRERIEDAGTLDEQTREASSVRPVVDSWLSRLEHRAVSLTARVQEECQRRKVQYSDGDEPFALQTERYLALVLTVGALVTMSMDFGLSALLATNWINLSWGWAVAVGAAVGLALSLMCKAGLLAWVYDSERPRPTRRRLQLIATSSFSASFIFLTMILATRSPGENWIETVMTLTSVALGALGVLLPILAGALLALAYDFNWSYRHEREYRWLRHEIAETNGFLEWLKHLRGKTLRAYPALFGPLLLSLALAGAAQAAQEPVRESWPVLELWVDDSGSIQATNREKGVENLGRQLPGLLTKRGIKEIRVLHFSHDPWTAQPAAFVVPTVKTPPCANAQAKGETGIFKQFEEHRRRQCAAAWGHAQRMQAVEFAQMLTQVGQALLKPSGRPGPCTALYDLFSRLALNGHAHTVVIITDGEESCRQHHSQGASSVAAPHAGSRVLVLLLPGQRERQSGRAHADAFRQKRQDLTRLAAWAKVEPLFSERLSEVF